MKLFPTTDPDACAVHLGQALKEHPASVAVWAWFVFRDAINRDVCADDYVNPAAGGAMAALDRHPARPLENVEGRFRFNVPAAWVADVSAVLAAEAFADLYRLDADRIYQALRSTHRHSGK